MKSNRGVEKERARRTGRGSMMQVTCSGYIRCLDTNFSPVRPSKMWSLVERLMNQSFSSTIAISLF